jgi:hypothetical protein
VKWLIGGGVLASGILAFVLVFMLGGAGNEPERRWVRDMIDRVRAGERIPRLGEPAGVEIPMDAETTAALAAIRASHTFEVDAEVFGANRVSCVQGALVGPSGRTRIAVLVARFVEPWRVYQISTARACTCSGRTTSASCAMITPR